MSLFLWAPDNRFCNRNNSALRLTVGGRAHRERREGGEEERAERGGEGGRREGKRKLTGAGRQNVSEGFWLRNLSFIFPFIRPSQINRTTGRGKHRRLDTSTVHGRESLKPRVQPPLNPAVEQLPSGAQGHPGLTVDRQLKKIG